MQRSKTAALALMLVCFTTNVWGGTLMQYYEKALAGDPRLRAAQANRYAADELRPQALALLLPQLSLDGSATRNYRDTNRLNENYYENDVGVSINLPLLDFAQWIRLDQASVQISAAQADFETAQLDLIIRVAEAYFGILAAEDSLNFASAEIDAIARQLDQAQERYNVGVVTINDVYEAQAAYDQAMADKVVAENSLENAREALRAIVGEYPRRQIERLRSNFPMNPPNPAHIDKWTQLAMERNSEILAARKRSESSKDDIRIERSGHLPTLNLEATASNSQTDYSLGTDTDLGTISVQIKIPLYSGGLVSSRTRQARQNYQASLDELEAIRRNVHQAVRDAYRGMIASISRAKALAAALKSSSNALEATKAGFEVGTRTMVDVLNEQRSMFLTRRDRLRAQYDYILNGLRLKRAAGMLKGEDIRLVDALLTRG